MKERIIFILVGLLFLVSCDNKQSEMRKDAQALIKISQQQGIGALYEMDVFMKSLSTKYKGTEMKDFFDVLRNEVQLKKSKGEDCGAVELLYPWEEEFEKTDSVKNNTK
jgi:hypothetical protein